MFAVFHHPDCEEHVVPGHPERPQRVKMTLDFLRAAYSDDGFLEAPISTAEHWLLFHTDEHVNKFNKLCDRAENKRCSEHIDVDTVVTPNTRSAVCRAVGSAIAAVDGIYSGELSSAFCCVRPPGHHAEPDRAMGFCFMNNAAIAAQYARKRYGVKKVAILDFDVHHGNGTDLGFQDDPDMFYGSTHERDNFPGTGPEPKHKGPQAVQEVDRRIVNRYLSPGSISKMQFRAKWAEIISEMELFKPNLIIFSAGFDAHTQDPLGGCNLDEEDFAWATQIVLDATYRIDPDASVPCMSILEGGYNLSAVAKSVVLHCGVLRNHKPVVRVRSSDNEQDESVSTVVSADEIVESSPVTNVSSPPEDSAALSEIAGKAQQDIDNSDKKTASPDIEIFESEQSDAPLPDLGSAPVLPLPHFSEDSTCAETTSDATADDVTASVAELKIESVN